MKTKTKKITLERIIESLPGHVYWKNKEGVYMGCNLQQLRYLNLSYHEMIGKTDYDLPWRKKADELREIDRKVIEEEKAFIVEETVTGSTEKENIFLSHKIPLYDEFGNIEGIIGVSLDITELKEVKRQLEEALIKVNYANTEREKVLKRYQQFVNDQEHDIRTPVGGVASGTVAIEPMIKDNPDEALEILKLIQISSQEVLEYQESLLYDLYGGTRPGSSAFIRFNLPDIIQRIYNINLSAAKLKNLNYQVVYDESIPDYLVGDGKRVYQCLLDLVGNAIRFTYHGSVTIEIKYMKKSEDKVFIRFRVVDTGIGIPLDKQQDIYDAFVKIKPSNRGGERGRGLGLTRVHQYAEDMKGELWFTSEEDKGSCFNLILPFGVSLDQIG